EIPAKPQWCEIRTTVFSWTPTRFPFHTGTAKKLTFGKSPIITVVGKASNATPDGSVTGPVHPVPTAAGSRPVNQFSAPPSSITATSTTPAPRLTTTRPADRQYT